MTHPAPLPLVRTLEECAFNAWPAHQTVFCQGWVLRLAGGFTKRANSANPLAPEGDFDAVQAEARTLYARHGLPVVFRVTPLAPPGADAALQAAGYAHFDPSLVLQRALAPLAPRAGYQPPADVALSASPPTAWLDGFAAANGVAPHHRALHHAMLESIAPRAAFATLRAQGQAVGFGLAVCERGWVGLFDIAVAPAHQGCGRGRTLVQALLDWGAAQGARGAYLQVRTQNTAALRLYEALGFAPAYAYHYRMPPQG